MKTFTTLLVTILVLITSNAFAWGRFEQGLVWGVGGSIIAHELMRPQPVQVYPAYYPERRRYVEPYHERYIDRCPERYKEIEVYDRYGNLVRKELVPIR